MKPLQLHFECLWQGRHNTEGYFYSHTLHLLRDGMAIVVIKFFIYMDTQDHSIYRVWIHLPEEKKTIWSELELNPSPFASQATALTTRPLLLGPS